MTGSLSDLTSAVSTQVEADRARQRMLQEQFERLIFKQIERCIGTKKRSIPSELADMAAEAVRIVQQEPLEVRRVRGMEVLSGIIMRIYCMHLDEHGDLKSLPLKRAAEISGDEEHLYTTYLPSTTIADAHERAEILLVGEAPAFAETKAGVPLADLWNISSSVCSVCVNFERCFRDTVLIQHKARPRFDSRLFGCEFSEVARGYTPQRAMSVSAGYCYTAGELLRQLLLQCGIGRASWRRYLDQIRPRVLAVATNAIRRTNLGRSGSGGISNRVSDAADIARDAGWLWLEAAMMQPSATVLLGNVALESFGIASGSRRKGSGAMDYVFPFGMVYKSYHPSALIRTNVIMPWSILSELETALSEQAEHESVRSPKWKSRAILVHLFDTLSAAVRYVQSPDPMDDRAVGYADILPAFMLAPVDESAKDDE